MLSGGTMNTPDNTEVTKRKPLSAEEKLACIVLQKS
jgi:hypothetical protein